MMHPLRRLAEARGPKDRRAVTRGHRPHADDRCRLVAHAALSPRVLLSARCREGGTALAMLVPEAEQDWPPRRRRAEASHATLVGITPEAVISICDGFAASGATLRACLGCVL
jgi:hypothetical protein